MLGPIRRHHVAGLLLCIAWGGTAAAADAAALDAQHIFDTRCRDCHALDKRRVGPALAGAAERRSREWLTRWLHDPVAMVKSDEVARKLMAEYKTQMPNLELSREEIAALIDWLASHPAP